MDIFVIIILIIILSIIPVIIHAPLFKVKGEQLNDIKEHGLIHFANPENVICIKKNGLTGHKSYMGGELKK